MYRKCLEALAGCGKRLLRVLLYLSLPDIERDVRKYVGFAVEQYGREKVQMSVIRD